MSKLGHIHFDRYFGINTNDKPENEMKKWIYRYDYNIIMIWYATIQLLSDVLQYNYDLMCYNTIMIWCATIQLWSDVLQYNYDLICYNTIMIWYATI